MNYKLPDDVINALRALADSGELAWRQIGRVTGSAILSSNGTPRMLVYQEVAYTLGYGLSTVRLYHQLEHRYGELLEELPMVRLAHLRLALREARATKRAVIEVINSRLDTSKGGALIAPDAWKAELKNGSAKGDPAIRALDSAERNIATFIRACPRLAKKAGMVLDEVAILKRLALRDKR